MRSLGGGGAIPPSIASKYEIHDWRNAVHVLSGAHPAEWGDVLAVLDGFVLKKSEVIIGGGRKSKISDSLDSAFYARGWEEKEFKTTFHVDDEERSSRTHKIDCYKNLVGLELEWNSKDQTFVRDLNNFRVLFELQVLDAGVIVTRCDELQQIFDSLGIGGKYGASTTHMAKLLPRLSSGGGGGCPVLVFGIRATLFDPNQ
ncbi:MAG TPA: BglII/BstYI family type II restriction endonuclease [Chloroflexota bacterium]|nr:BglII/BstYI family type II restriction endonuclease [Chloroflexota bacterium]